MLRNYNVYEHFSFDALTLLIGSQKGHLVFRSQTPTLVEKTVRQQWTITIGHEYKNATEE